MERFQLHEKDFAFNASLDPIMVLERMGFSPKSFERRDHLLRLHCPIHNDLIRKSLIIDTQEKTFRCQKRDCVAHEGGLLIELIALYYSCDLDEISARLFEEQKSARDLAFRGEMLINQGLLQQATPYLERAIAQNPHDEITRCKMAALYLELDQKDDAYREYMKAAESYAVRGELEKTLSIYNILLMLQPGSVKARQQLALLFARMNRPDAAAEQMKWVIDFYNHHGKIRESLKACDLLLEIDNRNPEAAIPKGANSYPHT